MSIPWLRREGVRDPGVAALIPENVEGLGSLTTKDIRHGQEEANN